VTAVTAPGSTIHARRRRGTLPPEQGGNALLNVTFFGVRGSTPCPCDANLRYGGNTSCVVLESAGSDPIVLDMGTGLRYWGETQPHDGTFRAHALVTHLHFDHVQGLPFLAPADRPGARFDIYGPQPETGETLAEAFEGFIRPPYFPIRWSDLRGDYLFHEVSDADVVVGDAKVSVRTIPHVGVTNGYRVELGHATVAYLSDHQQPMDGTFDVPVNVRQLAEDADLLIHDAQYTPDEFAVKTHWGHCTVEYAVHVAEECGVATLALFHHDPGHDDDAVDGMLRRAEAARRPGSRLEVLAAYEGLTVALGEPVGGEPGGFAYVQRP
jgi:phosphoribosyl 1,2-cyclic phosphodiesterase